MPEIQFPSYAGNGSFPHPSSTDFGGIICLSESLQASDILLGYRFGLFPLNEPEEDICWWSPDPRWLLPVAGVKVRKSMRSLLNSRELQLACDTRFDEVLQCCAAGRTRKMEGTWIDDRIVSAYTELHLAGRAHSIEVLQDGALVAGFYGVQVGRVFVGESMFTHISNGSKYALIRGCDFFSWLGIPWVDCQMHSDHLESMGALPYTRAAYLRFLKSDGFQPKALTRSWTALMQDYLADTEKVN